MKSANLLIGLLILPACSTLPKQSTNQYLRTFDNQLQAEAFTHQRRIAIEKIESYPTKTQFWAKFKFWKNWRNLEEEIVVTGIRASAPDPIVEAVAISENNITNNQEKNVDEGGIVKRLGDYMIILRRGKLYSLHIGQSLTKADEISVQQDNWQHHAWYDEILADNGQVVVVGYSYDSGASEYLFFDIDGQGKFTRGAVHLVTSNDYFSSENYASRLVDGNLVFLIKDIPITKSYEEESYTSPLSPYTTTIDTQGKQAEAYSLFKEQHTFAPIMADIDVYATTVALCPLNSKPFSCRATTILGGYSTETYASRDAYYIWMTGADWDIPFESMTNKDLKRYAWNEYFETLKKMKGYQLFIAFPMITTT